MAPARASARKAQLNTSQFVFACTSERERECASVVLSGLTCARECVHASVCARTQSKSAHEGASKPDRELHPQPPLGPSTSGFVPTPWCESPLPMNPRMTHQPWFRSSAGTVQQTGHRSSARFYLLTRLSGRLRCLKPPRVTPLASGIFSGIFSHYASGELTKIFYRRAHPPPGTPGILTGLHCIICGSSKTSPPYGTGYMQDPINLLVFFNLLACLRCTFVAHPLPPPFGIAGEHVYNAGMHACMG